MPMKRHLEFQLKRYNILSKSGDLDQLLNRLKQTITESERNLEKNETESFASRLISFFLDGKVIPSSVILSNIGKNRTLSACAFPILNLDDSFSIKKTKIERFHRAGMGTGFNLNCSDNPVQSLLELNTIALQGLKDKLQRRPVGNTAILSVNHPRIEEFITAKATLEEGKEWAFNIMISISDKFMKALEKTELFHLENGSVIQTTELFNLICEAAWSCGDPGIVFSDRFEEKNPISFKQEMKAVAPCGEVSLSAGEVCHFAYLNLSAFEREGDIDYPTLKLAIEDTVRFLDDILFISIKNFPGSETRKEIERKRRIGIGFCGLAMLLLQKEIAFGSLESITLAKDLMALISFYSKKASVELAKQRGWAPVFSSKTARNRMAKLIRNCAQERTNHITAEMWLSLACDVQKHGMRNISTTALPPTSRSSLVFETSPSIEPFFSFDFSNRNIRRVFQEQLEERGFSLQKSEEIIEVLVSGSSISSIKEIPADMKLFYSKALDIRPKAQVDLVAEVQKFTDESISKTVNIEHSSNVEEVSKLFCYAFHSGLKGITIYRDGCKANQPEKLT